MDLEFSDDALTAIANKAIVKGTGARGLRSILVNKLYNYYGDSTSHVIVFYCRNGC